MSLTLSQARGFRRLHMENMKKVVKPISHHLRMIQMNARPFHMAKAVEKTFKQIAPWIVIAVHQSPEEGTWFYYWSLHGANLNRQRLCLQAVTVKGGRIRQAERDDLQITHHVWDRFMQFSSRFTETMTDNTAVYYLNFLGRALIDAEVENGTIYLGKGEESEVWGLIRTSKWKGITLAKTFIPWTSFNQQTLDEIRLAGHTPSTQGVH